MGRIVLAATMFVAMCAITASTFAAQLDRDGSTVVSTKVPVVVTR